MPEPDCFHRYRIGYGTSQLCLGCQRAALLRGILRRENPTYTASRDKNRHFYVLRPSFFVCPGGRPCGNHAKHCINKKTIQCLPNPSQHLSSTVSMSFEPQLQKKSLCQRCTAVNAEHCVAGPLGVYIWRHNHNLMPQQPQSTFAIDG